MSIYIKHSCQPPHPITRYSLHAVLIDGLLQLEHIELPEHEHRPECAHSPDAPPHPHRVVLRVRAALKHLQRDVAELDVAHDPQQGALLDVRHDPAAAGEVDTWSGMD